MNIKDNLYRVRERIAKAAAAAGRDIEGIRVIGAIKNVPDQLVLEALEAGLTDLGENRVQEARGRCADIRLKFPRALWHMIGHLQRNKVRQSLELFDIIHSIDSMRLADELRQRAGAHTVSVLIEVNTSGEETKYGVPAGAAVDLLKNISDLGNIRVEGLMTIAPLLDNPEEARPCFKKLKELFEAIKGMRLPNTEMKYLSMGMSDDFEAAVQEGANMLRIGRAIFGERKKKEMIKNG